MSTANATLTATLTPGHRRHFIYDRAWGTIAPHLSGGPGKVGRPAGDSRRFSNAVFWILGTGTPGAICRRTTDGGRRAASGANCRSPCLMILTLSG